jgi:hypothetical protein
MKAILILIDIVVVSAGLTLLVRVPVRYVEAVAKDFPWLRTAALATPKWVTKESDRRPAPSPDIRNVRAKPVKKGDDPDRVRYTYERRRWRKKHRVPASGHSHADLREPQFVLRPNEVHRKEKDTEKYEVRFVSADNRRYSKKLPVGHWRTLENDARYQLGRNVFGRVRTIDRVGPETGDQPEPADQDGTG